MCRSCSADLPAGARFCPSCGTPAGESFGQDRPFTTAEFKALEKTAERPSSLSCPRCALRLTESEYGPLVVDECFACSGMWFDLGELDEFLRRFTEKKRRLDPSFASKRIQRFTIEGPEGYLPCPRCGDLMNRSNYGRISGVLIDSCKPHGMWLDGGEADKIAVFIESGGLAEAERRKVEDLKRQASSAQAELDSARRARNRAWSIGPVIFWDVW